MARLERIYYEPFDASQIERGVLHWAKTGKKAIERLPQIFWKDGRGWDEVNVWALMRATSGEIDFETIVRLMKHLCRYADFLETEKLDWRHFPVLKADRVLWKFKGYLIEQRDKGLLAGTTVTNCMLAVIAFYRFAQTRNLVRKDGPLWADRTVVIPFHNMAGFERSILVLTSELSIPNKRRAGVQLEDNLLPLRSEHMTELLQYTAQNEEVELHYMLSTGFFTGARLGTVITLTDNCLRTAREDSLAPGIYRLKVGPGTGIETKSDVSGEILIPKAVLDDLKTYATSSRRLLRAAKADPVDKHRLFLTRSGKPYSVSTMNRLVQEMRKRAAESGLPFMHGFKFHQSRATFGTWLVEILLNAKVRMTDAIGFVRDAMLHKDEATTLRYIKFYQNGEMKKMAGRVFNEAFTGLRERDWNKYTA